MNPSQVLDMLDRAGTEEKQGAEGQSEEQPGPSGLQTEEQPGSSGLQTEEQPGPSGLQTEEQEGSSGR